MLKKKRLNDDTSSPDQCHQPTPQYIPITNDSQLVVDLNIPQIENTCKEAESSENEPVKRITRSMRGIVKPKTPYVGTATTGNPTTKPQSVNEALSIPHWKQAMEDEFNALQRNQMWELVPYHHDL